MTKLFELSKTKEGFRAITTLVLIALVFVEGVRFALYNNFMQYQLSQIPGSQVEYLPLFFKQKHSQKAIVNSEGTEVDNYLLQKGFIYSYDPRACKLPWSCTLMINQNLGAIAIIESDGSFEFGLYFKNEIDGRSQGDLTDEILEGFFSKELSDWFRTSSIEVIGYYNPQAGGLAEKAEVVGDYRLSVFFGSTNEGMAINYAIIPVY